MSTSDRTPVHGAPPRRGRHSRELIARAALAILDREGLDALSMRRLAEELGMGTMTLYGYYRSKDELLDAIVDLVAAEHRLPPAGGSWEDRLRWVAHELLRGLQEHPELVRLRLRRPILAPGALRHTEAGVRALIEAGFDAAAAASAFRIVFLYAFAFAAFSSPTVTDELRREVLAVARTLPPDDYPTITQMAPEMAETLGGIEQFDWGLERIIDGLRARLGR